VSWLGFKAKLYAAGTVLLAVLGFFVRLQYVKGKVVRLEYERDTLAACVLQDKIIREREREVKEEYRDRELDALKELEKANEKFKGVDSLSNPNDW
jgi:hypothetical protein